VGCPNFTAKGLPEAGWGRGASPQARRTLSVPLARLLMQAQGSQQVSPQSALRGAEAAVCFAGVAQSVEHLFCKQVVRGSSPRASSVVVLERQFGVTAVASKVSKVSESCPRGQREQAVNLPAYAYAGSNPALSTSAPLSGASGSTVCGTARALSSASLAGVAQLVERQPSKLNVEGSSPFSRSVRVLGASPEQAFSLHVSPLSHAKVTASCPPSSVGRARPW
jgi:hypothetical protein